MPRKILITAYSDSTRLRLQKILNEYEFSTVLIDNKEEIRKLGINQVGLIVLPIQHGFYSDDLIVVSEQDLLGEKVIRKKPVSSRLIDKILKEQSNIQEGELIVHKTHGLGQFLGLETINIGNTNSDFLKLRYSDDALLFVPIENFDLITRYGEFNPLIKLDKLGSAKWSEKKAKVRKKIKEIADELIKIASQRQLSKADVLIANEGEYAEFCARFPYTETKDQLNAIKDIESDLSKGIPMDRLVCGDVGFGKTEVALRAAFIATHSKKPVQVTVVTPTTLLCRQHFEEFCERFEYTDLKVGKLSRMMSSAEIRKTKKRLEQGDIDIIIGTHSLLSESVKFKNLGLVIVDEEQKFGVKQKERLKNLKNNVHILILSATPIPRTLQMSISGIRDLSLITTPPVDRLSIHTFITQYDEIMVREAINRETCRGGRVFFVVPQIRNIGDVENKLKFILPGFKYGVAHGQMSAGVLEKTMSDFYDGKFQLLISTSIIESGLDVKMANTIIVFKADRFGLAQLYQLRGRVGRGKTKAYAYLMTDPKDKITEDAKKRLEVMESLDSLGVGFNLASNDMSIRGSGNLIGEEQSGHIKETGVELYNHLLKEAVQKAKRVIGVESCVEDDYSPHVKLNLSLLIPADYIEDLNLRMSFYRRIADIQSIDEKEDLEDEMVDRFGRCPKETRNLLDISVLKILCKRCNVEKLELHEKSITVSFHNNIFPNPDALIRAVREAGGKITVEDATKVCFKMESEDVVKEGRGVLKRLIGMVNSDQ